MGNSANRILKIIQKSGTDTISEKVYLTVQSTTPLVFKLDDKLSITKEFYLLSDDIVIDRLAIGDKVIALTFNDGQCYFIHQSATNKIIKRDVINTLNSNSDIDMLSAKQGKLLNEEITNLKSRVGALEQEVIQINATLENYNTRITTLENKLN